MTSGMNASRNESTHTGPPPRVAIGVALTLGFTLMFVVDQIGSYLSTHGKLAELFLLPNATFTPALFWFFLNSLCLISDQTNRVGVTATLGLVIHAAGTDDSHCTLIVKCGGTQDASRAIRASLPFA